MIKGYKHCAEEGGMLEGLYESLPSFQQFKKTKTTKKGYSSRQHFWGKYIGQQNSLS